MDQQKNTIIAVVLSGLVLLGWQYFYAHPQAEKQRQIAQEQAQKQAATPAPAPGATPQSQAQQPGAGVPQPPAQPGTPPSTTTAPATPVSRDRVIAASPRVKIDTPTLAGSIALKGARIDDLALVKYRETVDPKSPAIVLLSPSGTQDPFYAEFGWVPGTGVTAKLPDADTLWRQDGSNTLSVGQPVKLVWDNGEGLEFRRTIAVDDRYLFTVTDEVANKGSASVTLFPYGLISRHGTPHTLGYYILHEGLIGVMGDQGLQETTYADIEKKKEVRFDVTNGWLGITDKYWAATLLPQTTAKLAPARFLFGTLGSQKTYQADYLLDAVTIAPGATGKADTRLFAGAKEVATVDNYDKTLGLNRFELLIDWGWFYFITKPVFWTLDYLFKLTGNFGIAILLITVMIKAVFVPLANKSYASMAKMKAVQPKMAEIKEKYPDDKMKQQQAMMELYKSEKINPLAGCLPIAVQIPVFYSLYKVLFVTIEMRHAPFFGWIHDLSAPDPTNIFTLFGLIPVDPTTLPMIGSFLHLGVWPIIMGITMWFQMKLNPQQPDPTQQMIFNWMPVVFTFMLASFPAGLVIYWAWNNTLSVVQQGFIMSRHGVKVELFSNLKNDFAGLLGRKKSSG